MKIKITTIIRFPRIVRRTANLNSLVEGFVIIWVLPPPPPPVIMSSLVIFWQTPPSPSSDDVIYEQPLSWSQPSGSLYNYAFGNVCTSKPGCIVLLSIFEVDIGQLSDRDLKNWLHRSKINGQRFFVLGASWGLPVAIVIVLHGIADLELEKSIRNVKTLTRKISKKCQTFSRKSKNLDQKNSN